jgi:hypothetical protein
MTIVVAWERRLPRYSEIIFCSDSRLTGGGNIDVCQKLFTLPREDAAIAFCGSTLIAYPLIHQFTSYIKHFKKNVDRALDASELPGRFCDLINKFLKHYIDPVDLITELRETSFLIGYFSWKLGRPFVYRISYDAGQREYVAVRSRFPKSKSQELHRNGQFGFIGDLRHNYLDTLMEIMNKSGRPIFNMQPFEAVSMMLGDGTYVERKMKYKGVIGGAPQMLKIYPFLRTIEFAIFWPSREEGKLYLNGRETFEYEKIHVPHLDASTLEIHYPLGEIGSDSNDSI